MSYCGCNYDPPTWISIRKVTAARKPHRCYECLAVIHAGEPYEYIAGKWDTVGIFHICERCVELREWAKISMPCFCWSYGDLHKLVREMVRDVAPRVPGFFMEYGRRMVRIRQVRRWNEDMS